MYLSTMTMKFQLISFNREPSAFASFITDFMSETKGASTNRKMKGTNSVLCQLAFLFRLPLNAVFLLAQHWAFLSSFLLT